MSILNNTICSFTSDSVFFHLKNFSSNFYFHEIESVKILKTKKNKYNVYFFIFSMVLFALGFFIPNYFNYIFWSSSLIIIFFSYKNVTDYNLIINLKNEMSINKKIEIEEKEIAKKSISIINFKLKENSYELNSLPYNFV